MTDYIKWLRSKVGHDPILLNAAGAFVTNERGQILLLRRGQGEKQNSWTVPGGIMELGETPREAAKREVLEETGLEVEIGNLVGVYTNTIPVTYPNGDACQMIDLFFTSRVVGGSIKADCHLEREERCSDELCRRSRQKVLPRLRASSDPPGSMQR